MALYLLTSTWSTPYQIGRITLWLPISRVNNASSSCSGQSLPKNALLRTTTPYRDCVRPISIDLERLSPTLSSNSSYQTPRPNDLSSLASVRTKGSLSSEACEIKTSLCWGVPTCRLLNMLIWLGPAPGARLWSRFAEGRPSIGPRAFGGKSRKRAFQVSL